MIIGIVTETYWPDINGVAMTLKRLVTGLLGKGHIVQLVCPKHVDRDISQFPVHLHYQPVKGFPIPGYKEANFGLPSQSIIKNSWRKEKPDIIYVATEGPLGWAAIKLANQFEIPVISGFHTNFHAYSKHYKIGFLEKIIKQYLRSLHKKTLTTLVPTEYQRKLINSMGIEHVAVLGRGVDTELFSPGKRSVDLRKTWGVDDNTPVLLYVGRIAPEKNLDLAVRAYNNLHRLNANIKFVLVGNGPLAHKLQKENPHFIFAGEKTGEELAAFYASCDIFLFPSITETFGNVVLEAMASGLGLVAFNYAAAAMHIKNEQNGVLAAFDNSDDFIHQAKLYLENEQLLTQVRHNARDYALTQCWSLIVNQFEELLETHSDFSAKKLRDNELSVAEYEN